MANCSVCGEKVSLFGSCAKCAAEKSRKEEEQRRIRHEALQKAEQEKRQREVERRNKEAERAKNIKGVLLTSETAISQGIVERFGFIMVEEMNSGLDLGLKKMAEKLLPQLQEKAFDLGANAVVSVRVEAIKVMDVGIGVTEMGKFVFVASGTAVKIED